MKWLTEIGKPIQAFADALAEWATDPVGCLKAAVRDVRRVDAGDWAYGAAAGLFVLSVGLLASAH